MKTSFLTLLFVALISITSAQTTTKKEHIKRLLELTGAGQLGQQMFTATIASYKQAIPAVPDEFWEGLQKEMKPEALVDLIIPIYDKYYTEAEILELTAFYQTTVGKKIVAVSPMIMQESMSVGQSWGQEIGAKVYSDLKAKGYVKDDL
ncbi:MAG: DUF2059 domain-containing protein [Bacteroidota bacterium]